MAVYLIFTLPIREEIHVHLTSKLIVGRGEDCDVVLPEAGVSSAHAAIWLDMAGRVVVQDLQSSNGTFKNGEQIKKTILQINDVLHLDKVKMSIDLTRLNERERGKIGTTNIDEIDLELSLPALSVKTNKSS